MSTVCKGAAIAIVVNVRASGRPGVRGGCAAAGIGWTPGRYEDSTVAAVAAWQARNMAGVTEFPGGAWADDCAKLFSADCVRA